MKRSTVIKAITFFEVLILLLPLHYYYQVYIINVVYPLLSNPLTWSIILVLVLFQYNALAKLKLLLPGILSSQEDNALNWGRILDQSTSATAQHSHGLKFPPSIVLFLILQFSVALFLISNQLLWSDTPLFPPIPTVLSLYPLTMLIFGGANGISALLTILLLRRENKERFLFPHR